MTSNSGAPPVLVGINARLFSINWRPVRQEIAFAREHGFASIQLPGPEHGLDADRLGDSLADVGRTLREAGLIAVMEIVVRVDVTGHTATGATPVDVLQVNLPAITTLPCQYVHWHFVPVGPMPVDDLRQLEQTLVSYCETGVQMAATYGFRLSVEHNEPAIGLLAAPQHCAALLADVPGLGLVWDINHTPPEQLDGYLALAQHVTTLHVADTPLPDVNHHLPLGLGTIDFAACFAGLREGGFAGPAILEIGGTPKSGGFGRDSDAALIDSGQRLRAIIAVTYDT